MNAKERNALLQTLRERFEGNKHRHRKLVWDTIVERLETQPAALLALSHMETSGGEPDVIVFDTSPDKIAFCDCSAESPAGRRSLCYDDEALKSRKENKPEGSAIGSARAMGIRLLKEEQYRLLQRLEEFDLKTSTWIETPPDIRALGGALFCDRRYGQVFVYHNGAQSYYAARGFRGLLEI